jgi:hypothetical protein
MKNEPFPQKVYIKRSKIKEAGRGVFAKVDVKKGEIIESSPLLFIPEEELSFIEKTKMINYLLFFGKNRKKAAFILGFGSLYNHSDTPNAYFTVREKDKLVDLIALKDIAKDKEVTFNYRGKRRWQ